MTLSTLVPVRDSSQVGEARRSAAALARETGLDETRSGRLALIVTEAANNLVRHAGGGELVLRILAEDPRGGVEVLALDSGAGMANVAECMLDGYSTLSTAGEGLGAISRQADLFDIHSATGPGKGTGTALLARVFARDDEAQRGQSSCPFQTGAVCLPTTGETACGDGWGSSFGPERCLVALVDGLGHGLTAADAAQVALRVFHENLTRSPTEILELAHTALRSTRGAAMSVTEIRPLSAEVRYAGIGNIAGCLVSQEDTVHLVSHYGTMGLQVRKFQEFVYPWRPDCFLIMYSDGLTSQWRLEKYPGLAMKHPSLVAGVLYRDFKRGRDDVTVLAVRHAAGCVG